LLSYTLPISKETREVLLVHHGGPPQTLPHHCQVWRHTSSTWVAEARGLRAAWKRERAGERGRERQRERGTQLCSHLFLPVPSLLQSDFECVQMHEEKHQLCEWVFQSEGTRSWSWRVTHILDHWRVVCQESLCCVLCRFWFRKRFMIWGQLLRCLPHSCSPRIIRPRLF
jgi:hypothetical protein